MLVRRLLRDPRVPRWRKIALALVLVYLIIPVDLVPDFIPVAGQLDDAILVALALHGLWRTGLIQEHWPGPAMPARHANGTGSLGSDGRG